jgi:hypothetical protein
MSYAASPLPRRAARALALALAALLVLPLSASRADHHIPNTGKTFAAYEYGWYPIHYVEHFVDGLPRNYVKHGPGVVKTQYGLLTVVSEGDQTTGVTLRREAHDRGRWEIRLRGKRFESGDTDFTVAAMLVPSGNQSYDCGARNIGFANFRPTGSRVGFHIRNLPNLSFEAELGDLNLSNNYWHTYGVEVTPRRISWFVDGKVRATERRSEALSGIPLALRLELQAVPGETMNDSRLQVDTVRYFTLKSPNDKSIRAPRPEQTTYEGACPAPEEPATSTP